MTATAQPTAPAAPSKLEHALALARSGFRVFPLAQNSKLPLWEGWPRKATTDEATIRGWWTDWVMEWEQDWNIGVATGDGLVVLDVDVKDGAGGDESLALLQMQYDALPSTHQVRTPTGSRHFYLNTERDTRNSAGKLADGLDIRGYHGFVVGPGSTINGRPYVTVEDGPPAACPEWLLALCDKTPERETLRANAAVPLVELDSAQAVSDARHYLQHDAPLAIEGDAGDLTTFRVAARVKDFGVSHERAFELLLDWNERCAPPWDPDDLERKVQNAYRYGFEPPGSKSPDHDFEPVPVDETADAASAKPPRFRLQLLSEIAPVLERQSLIEDVLALGAMSVLYGDSNTGKTFVMLDIGWHIASGTAWRGQRVEQGPVVYVAAEGGRMVQNRLAALKKHFGRDNVPLALVASSIDLYSNTADLRALVETVKASEGRLGGPPKLIVIDTLARAIAGGDENSGKDMGQLVRNLDALRAASGAHVAVVHHTGKDKAKGARGHSSLRAATDTELEVDGNAGRGVITVTKQRDMEQLKPFGFMLEQVPLGTNQHGKVVTSCVVLPQATADGDFGTDDPAAIDPTAAVVAAIIRDSDGLPLKDVAAKLAQQIGVSARAAKEKVKDMLGADERTANPLIGGGFGWADRANPKNCRSGIVVRSR